MLHHQTFLRCSRTTATILICASIGLFVLIGCASLFRSAGLSPEQAALQTAELKAALANATAEAIATVQDGLTEGQDLKTIAVKTAAAFTWKIIAASGATIGIILNGLLAKWLSTEKKITKALITGIESNSNHAVKNRVRDKAKSIGIEPQLHARVKALT